MNSDSAVERLAEGKKRYVRNTAISVAHQAVTMVAAFFLLPYILWRLGAEKYGLWVTAQIFSITGMVSLAELGFQSSFIRYFAVYATEGKIQDFKRLLVTGFLLFLLIGALCSGALLLAGKYFFADVFRIPAAHREELTLAVYVYALSLLFGFPLLVLKGFYAGIQDFVMLKLWEIVERLVFMLVVVVLLFHSSSVLDVILAEQAIILCLFIACIGISLARHRALFSLHPRHIHWRSIQAVTAMSGLVFLNNLSWLVYLKVPDVFIAYFLGPLYMTYYAIIGRFPRALKSIQGSLNAATLPFASMLESVHGSAQTRKLLVLRGLRYSFLLFTPVVACVLVFAEEILRVWVGSEYAFLGNYLRAFIVWQYAAVLVAFAGTTFTRPEHYRAIMGVNLAANILFVALIYAGIRQYQLAAVLLALLAGGALTTAISLRVMRQANQFTYREFFEYVIRAPVLTTGLVAGAAFGAVKLLAPWLALPWSIAGFVLAALAVLYFIYAVGLQRYERQSLAWLARWIAERSGAAPG
ncbi:MAG: oligosaccharide flippase family protein, partial [bacterium]